jgi:hypothetical protein
MNGSLSTFVVAFVIGIWIHQKYLAGRSIIPVIVGTLAIAQLFNWIFKVDTPPVQIFHAIQNRTEAAQV